MLPCFRAEFIFETTGDVLVFLDEFGIGIHLPHVSVLPMCLF